MSVVTGFRQLPSPSHVSCHWFSSTAIPVPCQLSLVFVNCHSRPMSVVNGFGQLPSLSHVSCQWFRSTAIPVPCQLSWVLSTAMSVVNGFRSTAMSDVIGFRSTAIPVSCQLSMVVGHLPC